MGFIDSMTLLFFLGLFGWLAYACMDTEGYDDDDDDDDDDEDEVEDEVEVEVEDEVDRDRDRDRDDSFTIGGTLSPEEQQMIIDDDRIN